MMMNAHNIVQLYGTGIESGLTQAQSQQAEKIVEQLIALYSLGYVGSVHKAEAKEVLRSESQRSEGNGVEALLKLHKALETESKERLFKGNPALMVHGYTWHWAIPRVQQYSATQQILMLPRSTSMC